VEAAQTSELGKVLVTGRQPFMARKTRAALRDAVFPARVTRPGFRSVFVVEAEGRASALAEQIYRGCHRLIGRATAVLAEVESKPQSIKDAAVKIGTDEIGPDESFCFRLTKRGLHNLQDDTPKLEHEIGGAINSALESKLGKKPHVSLENPDITINAEVLGPITLLGIVRKQWQSLASPEETKSVDEHAAVAH
jgi:tRNA(Ser,Leu) C12 N-acetylase TAN1